jgi:hypothetical protein
MPNLVDIYKDKSNLAVKNEPVKYDNDLARKNSKDVTRDPNYSANLNASLNEKPSAPPRA